MSLDLPIESVSGRDGWNWDRQDSGDRHRPTHRSSPRLSRKRQRPSIGSTPPEVKSLERELERKDRHKQALVERYEWILEERNRELAAARSTPADGSVIGGVRRVLRRLLPC